MTTNGPDHPGRHSSGAPLAPDAIVVPLDGSVLATAALVPAVALAHRLGTSVRLLSTKWDDDLDPPRRYLEAKAAQLGLEHVDVTIDLRRIAPEAILHAASTPGAVVCMTTHGRTRIREALVGSVAGEVVRRSAHPLLLVGPNALTRLSGFEPPTMGIALDGSPRADGIVPAAIEWAGLLDMQPWLLEVVDPSGELPPGSDVVEGSHLETVAHRFGDRAELQWDVLHGSDPAHALVEHAKTFPISLLAMTSHGRTGPAQAALGSVTLRIAHHIPCPLLVTGPGCS